MIIIIISRFENKAMAYQEIWLGLDNLGPIKNHLRKKGLHQVLEKCEESRSVV